MRWLLLLAIGSLGCARAPVWGPRASYDGPRDEVVYRRPPPPRPPPDLDAPHRARRDAILAGGELASFGRGDAALDHFYAERATLAARWSPVDVPHIVPFSTLGAGVAIDARDGRCYVLGFRLRGGAFSQLARRDSLIGELSQPNAPPIRVAVTTADGGGFTEPVCAEADGPATISLTLDNLHGSPFAREIGEGDVELSMFVRPEDAAEHDAADLEAIVAARTRGSRAEPLRGELDELTLRARYDECFVVVLRRNDPWPTGGRAVGSMSGRFGEREVGPGIVGPGAIFDFGCPLEDGAITLTIAATAPDAVRAMLYRRRAAHSELAAANGWDVTTLSSRAAYAREAERRLREGCTGCNSSWRTCLDTEATNCNSERTYCLDTWGLEDSACR